MESKCEFCNKKDAVGFFNHHGYQRTYLCKECYELNKARLEKIKDYKFYFLNQVRLENIRRQDRDRNY